MAQHTDEDRAYADSLADYRSYRYVVYVVDEPDGRGYESYPAHGARVAEHEAYGQCCHSYNREYLYGKGNGLRLYSKYGKGESIEDKEACHRSDEPRGVRCLGLIRKQEDNSADSREQIEYAAHDSTEHEKACGKEQASAELKYNEAALFFLLV